MRKFSAMSIDNFLQVNKEHDEVEEQLSENEEFNDIEKPDEGDVNPITEVEGQEKTNTVEGRKVQKTRGKTQCLKIHGRSIEEREEVILDDKGEPIGPTDKVVSDLSYFLGTIARNSDLCPVTYTNWKVIPDKNSIWEFVKSKFIIHDKGKNVVLARINDAWRRHKTNIRKKHFLNYKNLNQMLKNRPKDIPESHFRKLIAYWKNEDVKKMCQQNARNRAQQSFRHRMGPINFARIHARLCATKENNEQPSQAEMFIETRQSKKGKQLDEDTLDAIAHIESENQNSRDSAIRVFQSLFGKEKPGRVRCGGRVTTPSMLKRSEEIAALKQQHAKEKASLEGKVDVMQQEMDDLKSLVKLLLQKNSSGLDMEALATQLGCTSSGPNNSPIDQNNEKQNHGEGEEDPNHKERDD